MNPNFEFLDGQWMLVSCSDVVELFHEASRRAQARQWTLDYRVTDGGYEDFTNQSTWPPTTYGSATLTRPDDTRTFFWNTFTQTPPTRVIGGLYMKEFATDNDLFRGYELAMAALAALFWTEHTYCLVLTLEDDFGIDLAPGILGRYQPALWNELGLASTELPGLSVDQSDPRWVEVYPGGLRLTPWVSVEDLAKPTRRALFELESLLSRTVNRLGDAISVKPQ